MIINIERSHVSRTIITAWSAVFCFLCLIFTAFPVPVLAQTQYPWENDVAAEKGNQANRQDKKATQSRSQADTDNFSNHLKLGEFQVRAPDSWIKIPTGLDKDMDQSIIKVKSSGTSIAIVLDAESRSYSQDNNRIKFENTLAENVANNSPEAINHMNILGNQTIIIRSFDEDDNSTLFYVLPYDGTSTYYFYITYEQRVHRLTPEVKAILSTLEFIN